jgi:hypothetical protein
MFGYVFANVRALSKEDEARYRACYCGLCQALRARGGFAGQMTLTYDMTFLILLLSSLYEPKEQADSLRCATRPFRRHAYWTNRFTDYAADMNLALAYYNCLDDWQDDKNLFMYAEAGLIKKSLEGVRARYPRQLSAIEACMAELREIEQAANCGFDAAINCFGKLMGELFVPQEDEWSPRLRAMAGALGRFIYVMDAYEDVDSDIKKGRFNPLASARPDADFEERARELLELLIGECAAEFEKLPLIQDAELLRNILYSGLWARYYAKKGKRGKA